MRIDGKALLRAEVKKVNEVIDRIWHSPDTKTVETNKGMIHESYGPDAIELLNGGDDWVVFDRNEPHAVILHEDGTTWIASHDLFEMCAKFSPLERITWHKDCTRFPSLGG